MLGVPWSAHWAQGAGCRISRTRWFGLKVASRRANTSTPPHFSSGNNESCILPLALNDVMSTRSAAAATPTTRSAARKRKPESVDAGKAPPAKRARSKISSSGKAASGAAAPKGVKAKPRAKPSRGGVMYIAKVAHSDDSGEHEQTLGVFSSKAACAKVVREHIEKEYGTDLCDQYEVTKQANGFVRVYASGWEGESMDVFMTEHKIKS